MDEIKRVLLVGHCGPDTWVLKSWVKRTLPGAQVSAVNDDKAVAEAGGDTLLLVNRALDGRFADEDGIELIRRLNAGGEEGDVNKRPVMMLVSNYADAQRSAEEAGARPGFGKSDIGSKEAAGRVMAAVGIGMAKSE